MKKQNPMSNVNFTFLWLILLLLASIIGASFYYQNVYGKMIVSRQSTMEELNKVSAELKARESELKQKLTELNATKEREKLAKEREVAISAKYDKLREEKTALEKEKQRVEGILKDTQNELTLTKTDLQELEKNYTRTLAKLNNITYTLQSQYRLIENLENRTKSLEKEVNDLKKKLECYQSGGNKSTCG